MKKLGRGGRKRWWEKNGGSEIGGGVGGGTRKKGAEGTTPFFITRQEGTQGFSFVNNDLFPLSPITLVTERYEGIGAGLPYS